MRSLVLGLLLLISPARAVRAESPGEYRHLTKQEIPAHEQAFNFGIVYLGQWLVYGITQNETIADHATWKNFRHNTFSPHFDRDNLEYNVIRHSLAGASYYLYYRSRGYAENKAFLWTIASSIAFEFTIETFTERPSYQDVFQTPAFGAALGMGLESVSRYFHNKRGWSYRFLGYVFNPFSLLHDSRYGFAIAPDLRPERRGLVLSAEF